MPEGLPELLNSITVPSTTKKKYWLKGILSMIVTSDMKTKMPRKHLKRLKQQRETYWSRGDGVAKTVSTSELGTTTTHQK